MSNKGRYVYEYKAEVIRIIDGDTVEAKLDLGFNTSVIKTLRLYGINTPEVRGVPEEEKLRGYAASLELKNILEPNENRVIIRTQKDKQGKYGRYLATLFADHDPIGPNDLSINELLVRKGYATYINM